MNVYVQGKRLQWSKSCLNLRTERHTKVSTNA